MKILPGPSPTSCITCYRRKKKCDKARPSCKRCKESGNICLGYTREASSNPRITSSDSAPEPGGLITTLRSNSVNSTHGENPTTFIPLNNDDMVAILWRNQQYAEAALGIHKGFGLPPRLIPQPHTLETTACFIISQYEPMFEIVSFRPTHPYRNAIRSRFVSRMTSSDITRWSMYVGARMFHTLQQNGEYANTERFIPWLDRLDRLCLTSSNDVSLDDLVARFSAALELISLRSIISGGKHGYALLRRIAPVFIQVAFADPMLWPRDPASSGISLAHILVSPLQDLGRFVFLDTVSSLILGTPPLIEYDTSSSMIQSFNTNPMEWIYGCPSMFAFAIVKISQWGAQSLTISSKEDSPWKNIEHDIWTWHSRCDYGPDSESERLIMRFSVQEGWRHASLIYLYMEMCGVTSHDPRVQASVRQISLLYANIWSRFTPSVHFMIQILIAAVCTRDESDRIQFRALVSVLVRNKSWFLQGIDFPAVLDHLWHGVAADGGSITWHNYVNSRRAIVNLDV